MFTQWIEGPRFISKKIPRGVRGTADPSASPDFLLKLVALANFMRLSLLIGAHLVLSSAAWQETGYAPVGGCDFFGSYSFVAEKL